MVLDSIKSLCTNFFFFLRIFLLVPRKTVFKILIRGSNHPKRLRFLSTNKINRFHTLWPFVQPVIFLGDSHVEFLSRSTRPGIFAWWIGPHTISEMTRLITKELDSDFLRFAQAFVDAGFRPKIVISIGTVDVRTAVYELKLRGLLESDKDISGYFNERLFDFFTEFVNSVNQRVSVDAMELFVLKINSVDIDGYIPKNVSEILKIKKEEEIPILGGKEERSHWVRLFNNEIADLATDFNYRSVGFPDFRNKIWMSSDRTHLTDAALIEQLVDQILVDSCPFRDCT